MGQGDPRADRAGPGHQALVPPAHPGAGQPGRTGEGQDKTRARAHGWAGQGCGEVESGPAAALLGQGLMVPGG